MAIESLPSVARRVLAVARPLLIAAVGAMIAGWAAALLLDGLERFADSALIVRARVKTWPGKHWRVGRAYNERIKRAFDEAGIEIPTLVVTEIGSSPVGMLRSASASRTVSANSAASRGSEIASTAANSSPPVRAKTARCGSSDRQTSANSSSTRSPVVCP